MFIELSHPTHDQVFGVAIDEIRVYRPVTEDERRAGEGLKAGCALVLRPTGVSAIDENCVVYVRESFEKLSIMLRGRDLVV